MASLPSASSRFLYVPRRNECHWSGYWGVHRIRGHSSHSYDYHQIIACICSTFWLQVLLCRLYYLWKDLPSRKRSPPYFAIPQLACYGERMRSLSLAHEVNATVRIHCGRGQFATLRGLNCAHSISSQGFRRCPYRNSSCELVQMLSVACVLRVYIAWRIILQFYRKTAIEYWLLFKIII